MSRSVMRRRAALAVALLVVLAGRAGADRGGVVLLPRVGSQAHERALVEALRIYTRDLGLKVAIGPAATEARPVAQAAEVGRRAAAALVVWFDEGDAGPSLLAFRVGTAELRATPATPRDDPDLCAQTLALKLRALLVAETTDLRDWTPAPPAAAPAPPPVAPPPVTPPAPPVTPPPAKTPVPLSVAPPPPVVAAPARSLGFEAALAYSLDVPRTADLLRHGLVARAGLVFTRWPIAVELDGAVAFRATSVVDGTRVGVADYPVGLSLMARLVRPRFVLAAGARGALHIFEIDGTTADGRAGGERVLAAGLGGSVEARLVVTRWLGFFIAGSAEALVPQHRFSADGAIVVDLGAVLVRATAGVVFRVW